MNQKVIKILEKEIEKKLDYITQYSHPNDFEHIEDIKNDIKECRRAIAILKVFDINNLLGEILKK